MPAPTCPLRRAHPDRIDRVDVQKDVAPVEAEGDGARDAEVDTGSGVEGELVLDRPALGLERPLAGAPDPVVADPAEEVGLDAEVREEVGEKRELHRDLLDVEGPASRLRRTCRSGAR